MPESRNAIVRIKRGDTLVEVEAHPDDIGSAVERALEWIGGNTRRLQRRGRRRAAQPIPSHEIREGAPASEYDGPSTDMIREFLRTHPGANVNDVSRDLMGGRAINAQRDKWLYDAVYIRLFTARKQLEKEKGVGAASQGIGSEAPGVGRIGAPRTYSRGIDGETAIKAVEGISTEAVLEFVKANPTANAKDLTREFLGIDLHYVAPTVKAYRLAANKLLYARKKLGIPSPRSSKGRT
jgi:hypothetical protein